MTAEPMPSSAGFSRVCWFCKSADDLREQEGRLLCGLCFNEPGRAEQRRVEQQRAEEAYFWMTWDDEEEDDDDDGDEGYD